MSGDLGVRVMGGAAYDGSSSVDRMMATWDSPIQTVDQDIIPEKQVIDGRVRDTLRNDSYVAGGATLHKDNIVGSQFTLNAKPETDILGFTEAWEEAFQKEVEAKFTLWAESPNNWMDASSMNTLTGFIRLALGVYVQGGEVATSVEWLKGQARPFNTAFQMIDPDRLSNPLGEMERPGMRGGVEQDLFGAPIAYHVRKAHPNDWLNSEAYQWKRVPKTKPWGRMQFIHIIEQFRPDQTRGISEMVTALKECRVTKRFRDIALQKAVTNATYAATIESDLPTEEIFQRLGATGGGEEGFTDAIENYMRSYLKTVAGYTSKSKNLHLDGVRIPHLPPGSKLNLNQAGQGGDLGSEFEQSLLRYIAGALGVSYEQLSRDYTNTNYSSARAAMTETWKFMQSRKKAVADRLATHIYRCWLEEAINTDQLKSFPANKAGMLYSNGVLNMMFEALTACDWIGASRGQIDEKKETEAAILRIEAGISTIEIESARLGLDFRKIIRQRAREKRMLVAAGLWVEPKAKGQMGHNGGPALDDEKTDGEKEDA
jgi:lambda family phage portal protein